MDKLFDFVWDNCAKVSESTWAVLAIGYLFLGAWMISSEWFDTWAWLSFIENYELRDAIDDTIGTIIIGSWFIAALYVLIRSIHAIPLLTTLVFGHPVFAIVTAFNIATAITFYHEYSLHQISIHDAAGYALIIFLPLTMLGITWHAFKALRDRIETIGVFAALNEAGFYLTAILVLPNIVDDLNLDAQNANFAFVLIMTVGHIAWLLSRYGLITKKGDWK